MNVSKLLSSCLNKLYKILAITLVLLAVSVSGLRLMLPYAENYRLNLQTYINNNYQLNLVIGNLDAGWRKSGPSLVAKNVSLLQTDQASIFIDRIDLSLDFWASIQARQFITNDFTLSGTKIFIDKNAVEEQKNIKSINSSTSSPLKNQKATIERVIELFLAQIDHFSIRNSQIVVKLSENKRHNISINQLAWKNKDNQHNAQGDVVFGNLSTKNLKLQLRLNGNNQKDLAGTVYVEGNNIDITPWLAQIIKIDNEDTDSSISFKSWLSLKNGSAEKFQLQLADNYINWRYKDEEHQLSLLKGQFHTNFFGNLDQFQLRSSPLVFSLDQQNWQPITVQVSNREKLFTSYFSNLGLQNVAPLAPLLIADKNLLAQISELDPIGDVSDIFIQNDQGKINIAAQFSNVSIGYSQGIPGVENLSGNFLSADNRMKLSVKAKQGKLDFDKHFIRALPYQYLSAVIDGKFDQHGWHLGSENLIFKSSELELNGSIGVNTPKDGLTSLSLFANVNDIKAENAQFYFPHLLMGENLVAYLNKGLIEGDISQAKVLFNGPLVKFPFEDHSGIFTVNAELTNSTFMFDNQWPSITGFNANLDFTNNSMLITGRSGDLLGVDVSGVKAEIADLSGHQLLNINAGINHTKPEAVQALMVQSPLKNTVGKTLEFITLHDEINGEFSLKIPLNAPDKTIAAGTIQFHDNKMALKSPAMYFNKVNGQLSFENDKLNTKDLQVNWLGMPMKISVNAQNNKDHYQTNIAIDADWSEPQWQSQVPDLLRSYLTGNLAWHGDLNLAMPEKGTFSYQLKINSNLEQLQLNLPTPYGKEVTEKVPLLVSVNGGLEQSIIDAKIGKKLNFYGVLAHQNASFSRAHLLLGNEQMLLPLEGFHITTNIEQAKFSQWQPLISNIIASVDQYSESKESASKALLSAPERIRGTIKNLDIYGQSLSNVSFSLLDQSQWWLLQLNAKEARSQIKFYPDWFKQGIEVNADFLHLDSASEYPNQLAKLDKSVSTQLEENLKVPNFNRAENDKLFSSIPPIKVHCDSCSYGKLNFGQVDFSIKRKSNNVITLENFIAKRKKNELSLHGNWLHNEEQSFTHVEGRIHTSDIQHEFEQLGFASAIKGSGGTVGFSLDWKNAPQNFTFANLNGDLRAKIDDGYLAEVKDQARVFSILSLGSLVRKLTLDFRDIFSDGMFYSHIKGDFHIKDGVIYTDNTKMKGAAGDLVMKGNTLLTSGELDYRVSYKPNLTSSLPVLAWISTLNPVTFLAGVALDQVFSSTVVSEFKFELTGNVNEPNWREVTRKTRDVTVGRTTPPQFADNLDQKNIDQPDLEHNKIIKKSKNKVITPLKAPNNHKPSTIPKKVNNVKADPIDG